MKGEERSLWLEPNAVNVNESLIPNLLPYIKKFKNGYTNFISNFDDQKILLLTSEVPEKAGRETCSFLLIQKTIDPN